MTEFNKSKDSTAKSKVGDFSRRSFIQGSLAVGVSTSGAITFAQGAGAVTPKRGGHVRVAKADGSTTNTFNPANILGGFMISATYGLNGYLTGVGTDGSLEPELAESWEATPDAKTWRFTLRKGLMFHNGKNVTAEDVIASINYHIREGSTSPAKPLVEQVVNMKADGRVVEFDLSAGNADFPFTFVDYQLPILPSEEGEIDWQSHIGCGPYKLVEFVPGVHGNL